MSVIQDNLRAGDCAIIGVNTMDGTTPRDEFAILWFPPVVEDTFARITNRGAEPTGEIYSGLMTGNQSHTSDIWAAGRPAGAVSFHLKIPDANSGSTYYSGGVQYISDMKLVTADQLIVYQGYVHQGYGASTTNICAFDATGGWETGTFTMNSETSALPAGLTDGDTAVTISGLANNMYNGAVVRGTAAELRAAIHNPANWVRTRRYPIATPVHSQSLQHVCDRCVPAM